MLFASRASSAIEGSDHLCRIYTESQHCDRTYCDGDPPGRIARVREGWLRVIGADNEMQALSVRELPRGAQLLIPLLNDDDVDHVVPWSLAEIGDGRGIEPWIEQLRRDDPSGRV